VSPNLRPEEHFPRIVRHLSDQFGIQLHPRGLSLPGSRFPVPAMADVRGITGTGGEPHVQLTAMLPNEGGGLVDLTAGSGIYDGASPSDRSIRSFANWIQEDDAADGAAMGVPESDLEAWRDTENYGRDQHVQGGPFGGQSYEEALAEVPGQWASMGAAHPWVAHYNDFRMKDFGPSTDNGRYLSGNYGPGESYRLDPSTGEVVSKWVPGVGWPD